MPAILAAVRTAIDGKLRPGIALDASMEGLAKAIDAFEGLEKEVEDEKEIDAAAEVSPIEPAAPDKTTYDAEPLKAFLREKGLGEDDVMKVCDMMPKPALDADEESDDDKKKRLAAANDEDKKDEDMVTKPAMDEAIKTAVADAEKRVRATEAGIRTALAEVKPYVGELPATMAFDSGASVLRHALKMLNVDGHATLHADALMPVLKAQKRLDAKAPTKKADPSLAMDSSVVSKAREIAPGLAHIQPV